MKFSSKLFQENHPTNPSTKTSSKKAQKKNTSLKKGGGRKNSENSTLCHAVFFFCRIYHRIPFFWDTTTSIPLPSPRLYQNPGKCIKIGVFNHQDSEKKTHSMWRTFGHDFFLGGVNPPNPQSKAFFSGALKIKIHAWLGRLWVPWCFPKRTHGNPASSGNIARWRNGCIFPKNSSSKPLVVSQRVYFFYWKLREFPASRSCSRNLRLSW